MRPGRGAPLPTHPCRERAGSRSAIHRTGGGPRPDVPPGALFPLQRTLRAPAMLSTVLNTISINRGLSAPLVSGWRPSRTAATNSCRMWSCPMRSIAAAGMSSHGRPSRRCCRTLARWRMPGFPGTRRSLCQNRAAGRETCRRGCGHPYTPWGLALLAMKPPDR